MLLLVRKPHQLHYSQLMEVYREDICQAAKEQYGYLPEYQAVAEAEKDFYIYLTDVFFKTKNAFCAFWAPEGEYRSALRMEPYQDGYLLTGISTAPSYRRKGCGATLLQKVLDTLPAGTKIYAHVEKNNEASAALHRKCGFVPTLEYGKMLDGSVLHNFRTFYYGK